jgi:uncharacterized damage-inducible protein DinB
VKKGSSPAARKAGKPGRKSILRHSREGGKERSRRRARSGASRRPPAGAKQQYLDLYVKEFPLTLKVLKAYPSKKEDFKPHDRSGSAIKLVHTFIMQNAVVADAIRGKLKMPPNLPPAPATVTEGVGSYERGAKALIEAVRAAPESRLFERVDFFTGPGQMGKIQVRELLWMMLLDSVHHRGQFSVYIRMAGGKVPSIYGPSADEPWT